ncbi:hypothetical protein OV450_3519 [Actinobacteria bacterium OV450]|nr:hypothetical protein OV450_3519 [Actinobacteria bacterium OV450]
MEPPRWFEAAEAFGKAAEAMGRFAETVEWAQGKAKEALADYKHVEKVSNDAHNAYNKQVEAYKDAVKAKQDHLPPKPVEAKDFNDPGEPLASAAQDKLDSARKQRNEVADATAAAVRTARDKAPKKPSLRPPTCSTNVRRRHAARSQKDRSDSQSDQQIPS